MLPSVYVVDRIHMPHELLPVTVGGADEGDSARCFFASTADKPDSAREPVSETIVSSDACLRQRHVCLVRHMCWRDGTIFLSAITARSIDSSKCWNSSLDD